MISFMYWMLNFKIGLLVRGPDTGCMNKILKVEADTHRFVYGFRRDIAWSCNL